MAEVEEDSGVEDLQDEAVGRMRHRQMTAGIAVASLAVGIILGSVATLALAPAPPHVVSTQADGRTASTLQDLAPVPVQTSSDTTALVPVPTSHGAEPSGGVPGEAPATTPALPPSMSQSSTGQLPPARQRFVATLQAEPGWAPTDHFAGTITVVEAHDGSWHAEVAAEGLQPRHRHGAGVTWDPPFLSSFCIGMSDDAGRWTCTGRIDVQHVRPGAKLVSGDLGEGSGRIWAHGPIRRA